MGESPGGRSLLSQPLRSARDSVGMIRVLIINGVRLHAMTGQVEEARAHAKELLESTRWRLGPEFLRTPEKTWEQEKQSSEDMLVDDPEIGEKVEVVYLEDGEHKLLAFKPA